MTSQVLQTEPYSLHLFGSHTCTRAGMGTFPYLHACRYGNVPKRPLPHHSDDADGGDGDDGDGDGDDGDGDDGDGDADGGDGDLADRLDVALAAAT